MVQGRPGTRCGPGRASGCRVCGQVIVDVVSEEVAGLLSEDETSGGTTLVHSPPRTGLVVGLGPTMISTAWHGSGGGAA